MNGRAATTELMPAIAADVACRREQDEPGRRRGFNQPPRKFRHGAGGGYVRAVPDAHRGTVLTHASAVAPLRLFAPRITNAAAWVYTTTLGGGLVGGDDIRLTIDVEAGARVLSMTQASTKIYRSIRPSRQRLDATIGPEAVFVSLPDPVLPFAGSDFEQRQHFTVHERGSVLAMDGFTSGRLAFGEQWAFERYASRVEMIRSGRPIFYDHVRLDRVDQSIEERMRPFNVFLLLAAVGPAFAALTADVLARVAAAPIAPAAPRDRYDSSSSGARATSMSVDGEGTADRLVISASPLKDDGVIVRLAAVSVERATATLQELLRPIVTLLGEDPWARRF